MQKQGLKILFAVFTLWAAASFCFAQPAAHLLNSADSLFNNKQYTQSLEVYKKILEAGSYSPAMLLRMARVEEGLGHTARSLYYLNLNYLATQDERVYAKMEEVATRNGLEGYQVAPMDRFNNTIARYQIEINVALMALCVFFFSFAVYSSRRKRKPTFSFTALSFSVVLLLAVNFMSSAADRGIVTQAPIYLMSGPSAGADVLAIVGPGHRLKVEGGQDVWLKVQWKDQMAYIKKSQLLPIAL